MSDKPSHRLGGKTPLEVAQTPNMDRLARLGRTGKVDTSLPGNKPPGSDYAISSLIGVDECAACGRAPLEAIGAGLDISPDRLIMRCNLVTADPNGTLVSPNCGEISDDEARQLIDALNNHLDDGLVRFHHMDSFRHILSVDRTTAPREASGGISPDNFRGMNIAARGFTGADGQYLNSIMTAADRILDGHPVNRRRIRQGLSPANALWLWGGGYMPSRTCSPFIAGMRCGAVCGVNIVRGIALASGMEIIAADGANGTTRTNYSGKAHAAIKALEDGFSFAMIHIEAPDAASHALDCRAKITALERIDRDIIGPTIEWAMTTTGGAVILTADHSTEWATGRHLAQPVPFAVYSDGCVPDRVSLFNENTAAEGAFGQIPAELFAAILRNPRSESLLT